MNRVIVALTLLLAGSVGASDEAGHFAIKGAGTASCAQFTKAKSSNSRDFYVYAGWIDGYLTAVNRHRSETYDISPWASTELLAALVANFCQSHPEAGFHLATQELVNQLAPYRLTERSEIVRVENGEYGVVMYRAVLRHVQSKLAKTGYYEGEIDGKAGPATRSALLHYQEESNLPHTGIPDQRTLLKLLAPEF